MVNKDILKIIAKMNTDVVYNVTEKRPILKEDIKNFIIDLLHKCDDCEREWVLNEVDNYWK